MHPELILAAAGHGVEWGSVVGSSEFLGTLVRNSNPKRAVGLVNFGKNVKNGASITDRARA
jgi:hypothetical protein